jgi:hypothetical protein
MSDSHKPAPNFQVINLLPVLPKLDKNLLSHILRIGFNAQAVVGKRENSLPVLINDLLVLR